MQLCAALCRAVDEGKVLLVVGALQFPARPQGEVRGRDAIGGAEVVVGQVEVSIEQVDRYDVNRESPNVPDEDFGVVAGAEFYLDGRVLAPRCRVVLVGLISVEGFDALVVLRKACCKLLGDRDIDMGRAHGVDFASEAARRRFVRLHLADDAHLEGHRSLRRAALEVLLQDLGGRERVAAVARFEESGAAAVGEVKQAARSAAGAGIFVAKVVEEVLHNAAFQNGIRAGRTAR